MLEKSIYKAISKYDNIVVARHIGPDPDAVCSQLALRDSIRLTFPKKNVYAVGLSVSRFKYFGHLDHIDDSTLEKPLLIVLDVPNISRIDSANIKNYADVIKIDHHPYEDKMGSLEIVDTGSSSTCELIALLIKNTRLKMDDKVAENLYLGMVADSDRFLLSTTTARTLDVASYLVKNYNFDLNNSYKMLYDRPLNEFRFQAFLALNMTVTENGFAYMKITKEMINEYLVNRITRANGHISISELQEETNYSACYLRRVFKNYNSISPKQFARYIRFQTLLDKLNTNNTRYDELALDCGYFDEAHMMKEFKSYAGR